MLGLLYSTTDVFQLESKYLKSLYKQEKVGGTISTNEILRYLIIVICDQFLSRLEGKFELEQNL